MTKVVPISRDDELLGVASRWMLKLDEGALSASDEAALGAWLDEHTRHRELLLEVAVVWDKTDALARLADLFPHDAAADQVSGGTRHWRWAQGLAVAAGLAVLTISGVLLLSPGADTTPPTSDGASVTSAEYETAIGGQKTALLPDGSEVVLNTNSQLAVTFTPSARVLHLARGEILVRVAEDRVRPLSVVAGDRIIQALGTVFVVEITDERKVELMVSEGTVVIGIQPPATSPGVGDLLDTASWPPVLALAEGNVVSAGEAVTLSATDPVKRTVSADDVEVRLSWEEGRLIFRSEPLEKALQEVERYTTVEFVFLDESLRTRSLSGRFRAGDVEALLLSLRVNFNITHEYDGEGRVLLSGL
ncbi:MAG: FecR domain-containing protein [Gammaproteobacteria bacterium]|nr:FecR domain-containing protein [Gammaproteobacteria bacterium]